MNFEKEMLKQIILVNLSRYFFGTLYGILDRKLKQIKVSKNLENNLCKLVSKETL